MPERNEGPGEYDPDEEGPEARLHRDDSTEEVHRQRQVDKLIDSLRPEDAHKHLFTFVEILTWQIKNGRFRRDRR